MQLIMKCIYPLYLTRKHEVMVLSGYANAFSSYEFYIVERSDADTIRTISYFMSTKEVTLKSSLIFRLFLSLNESKIKQWQNKVYCFKEET